MECWHKMMSPMRRVWLRVSKRLGIRKTGLVKLQRDVQTCEYEDVHVLWEMLKKNETELTTESAPRVKRGRLWNMVEWTRSVPSLCRGF